MSYRRITVTDYGASVLALADAKAHLRVFHSDEDDEITAYVEAATRHVEAMAGTPMRAQTWRLSLDRFWHRRQLLPGGRVSAVSSITYFDVSETQVTLAPENYVTALDLIPAVVEAPDGWPGTQVREGAVTITYTVGGSAQPGLLQATKMLAAHWYQRREAVDAPMSEVPLGFDKLVNADAVGWYG